MKRNGEIQYSGLSNTVSKLKSLVRKLENRKISNLITNSRGDVVDEIGNVSEELMEIGKALSIFVTNTANVLENGGKTLNEALEKSERQIQSIGR